MTVDFTKADPTFVKHVRSIQADILNGVNRIILDDLVAREMDLYSNASEFTSTAGNIIKYTTVPLLAGACLHEYAMKLSSYSTSIKNALDEAVESLIALHIAKNGDYSAYGNDRWANIRACEHIGIPATTGVLIRVMDKINRYISLSKLPLLPRVQESIEDTLLDIVGYLIIYECLQSEYK